MAHLDCNQVTAILTRAIVDGRRCLAARADLVALLHAGGVEPSQVIHVHVAHGDGYACTGMPVGAAAIADYTIDTARTRGPVVAARALIEYVKSKQVPMTMSLVLRDATVDCPIHIDGISLVTAEEHELSNLDLSSGVRDRTAANVTAYSSLRMTAPMLTTPNEIGSRQARDNLELLETIRASLALVSSGRTTSVGCSTSASIGECSLSTSFATDCADTPGLRLSDTAGLEWSELVSAYLRCDEPCRRRLAVAIHRIETGSDFRLRPVDAAIDIGIALESMFSNDGETAEISYRLALRSALLLGTTISDRMLIRACVKKFYRERSRAVHTGYIDLSSKQDVITARTLAVRAVREIIRRGSIPDWAQVEIECGIEK
ncbi:MAG: HEPN domain-containing protein [Phycisphaerales bacterium]